MTTPAMPIKDDVAAKWLFTAGAGFLYAVGCKLCGWAVGLDWLRSLAFGGLLILCAVTTLLACYAVLAIAARMGGEEIDR